MITVNRIQDRITGMVNGVSYSCAFSEEKYKALRELEDQALKAASMEELRSIVEKFNLACKESYKDLVESATPHLAVNPATNQFFLRVVTPTGVHISNKPLPEKFAKRIIEAVGKKVEVEPLVMAWTRFLRPIPGRPAYSAERAEAFAEYISAPYVCPTRVSQLMKEEGLTQEQAEANATTTQVSVTREGLLVCYKVSKELHEKYALDDKGNAILVDRYAKKIDQDTGLITEDIPEFVEDRTFEPAIMGTGGDAFWCEALSGEKKLGHIIRVGHVHYLDNWNQVSRPGNKGLHCGGLSYIRGYQAVGTVTHNIFVDPSDIHTVYVSGDGVMTVKRYFVHSSFAGVNKAIYHASSYAAMTDKEYQELLTTVIQSELAAIADDLKYADEEAQALGQ